MTAMVEPRPNSKPNALVRALHTLFLFSRSVTLGVRAIVRNEAGAFLLVRHSYMPGWHFPGGGVERGQNAEHTLAKELCEETGLKLNGRPILQGVFFNAGASNRDHILLYLCKTHGQLPEKSPSLEIAELKYFDANALPDDIEMGTRARISELMEETASNPVW